ncbi:uncharacterized protein LOC114576049 [Exaiptasia diaphana]|uniref:Secreted protein n=1 Tax=Exaiptasia diaphana TaxID=2652724 RepID=A0A913YQS6_EXADI|nr:uncharacterized protein LOC114576049 [Exaiptasia diaphana]
MDAKNKILAIVVAVCLSSLVADAGRCSADKRLSPNKKLKHLRRHYYFVEKVEVAHLRQILKIPRRTRRQVTVVDNNRVGTSLCPWRWIEDEDSNRSPRTFIKAACSECKHYCRAVYFTHRALVKRCDQTTGRVWKWIDVLLPVAYVYDP